MMSLKAIRRERSNAICVKDIKDKKRVRFKDDDGVCSYNIRNNKFYKGVKHTWSCLICLA